MRKKITGLPPNFDFNPLPTRFNFTEFLPTSMHSESMQHIKRTSKHGISIVLKLVNVEYQKRAGCISGSCVAREKQTDISETWAYPTNTVLATVAFVLLLDASLLSQASITHYSQQLTLQHSTKLLFVFFFFFLSRSKLIFKVPTTT